MLMNTLYNEVFILLRELNHGGHFSEGDLQTGGLIFSRYNQSLIIIIIVVIMQKTVTCLYYPSINKIRLITFISSTRLL